MPNASEQLAQRERELRAIHRIMAELNGGVRLEEVLHQALRAAIETADASAGSILLHDPERDELVFRYVVGESEEISRQLRGTGLPAGEGIAGRVFRTGKGVFSPDSRGDPHHSLRVDRTAGYETRDMITVPLTAGAGRAIGVMQVLNGKSEPLSEADLPVLEILGGAAAVAIETARLHEELLDQEAERRRFACDVLCCVTGGKLRMVEPTEIPLAGRRVANITLDEPSAYSEVRRTLCELAEDAEMDPDRAADMVLAAGEAASNAMKHGHQPRVEIRRTAERLIARVSDEGPGIRPRDLPKVLFQAGFSTKISLGMGYTLMLELADCVWLATGPSGTIIQVEKLIREPSVDLDPLHAVMERYATV
jgi:anti-sigma regulatory factor (Ser/Thr protein kinase)